MGLRLRLVEVEVEVRVEVEVEVGVEVEVKVIAQNYFFGVGGWVVWWLAGEMDTCIT